MDARDCPLFPLMSPVAAAGNKNDPRARLCDSRFRFSWRILAPTLKVWRPVATEKSVITEEVWSAKIKRIIGHPWNPERCSHIGCSREWPDPAGIDAQPIHSYLINFGGADGPGVVKSYGLRLHGFHQFLDRLDIIVSYVFPRPGISSPQISTGSQNIVKPTGELIVVAWIAYNSGQIACRPRQIRLWHVLSIGKKLHHRRVPTCLWNGLIVPEDVS